MDKLIDLVWLGGLLALAGICLALASACARLGERP